MKTIKSLATIAAIVMPFCSFGAIDLLSIVNKTGPLNSVFADDMLGYCYLHNPQVLKNSEVNVDKIWKINGNTVFLCEVKNKTLPTEHYITTIGNKHGLVVDGAMIGQNGDSKILKIVVPRDEMLYQPQMNITFEVCGDTIKAKRSYDFFSTARGGRTISKSGTIYNCFVINDDGKILQLPPTATAIETIGDANYLSENHKLPTSSTTKGEFFPLGMAVLTMAQRPASMELDMEQLNNNLATHMRQLIDKHGENAKETPETLSVMEFAIWSFNLGMRHSNEFLSWIAMNPNKEMFSHFIAAFVSDNPNGEAEWLKENVNQLKDKKARKWWLKWIKNNL